MEIPRRPLTRLSLPARCGRVTLVSPIGVSTCASPEGT
jgi:hypothetical protein